MAAALAAVLGAPSGGGAFVVALLGELGAGKTVFVRGLVEGLGGDTPQHATLSDRELEVMRMLVDGIDPQQIAARMCLSPKTVSTYRSRILRKLNLSSNAALVRYALENALVY